MTSALPCANLSMTRGDPFGAEYAHETHRPMKGRTSTIRNHPVVRNGPELNVNAARLVPFGATMCNAPNSTTLVCFFRKLFKQLGELLRFSICP